MSLRVGLTRPSQLLKSPTTLTRCALGAHTADRKSTRLNSSHSQNSYAVFCLKKKNIRHQCVTSTSLPPDRSIALQPTVYQSLHCPPSLFVYVLLVSCCVAVPCRHVVPAPVHS